MNGYAAYGRVQNLTEDPRRVEYRLLAQATAALREAKENPDNRSKFYDALIRNKKVWDAFMVDLSNEKNRLPKPLKQSLINLSAWVSKHTFAVMDGNGTVDALIDVNSNVMDGLK